MAAISAGSGSGHGGASDSVFVWQLSLLGPGSGDGGASDSVFVWQLSLLGPGLVTEERLIQCLCGSYLCWVRVW